MILSLKIENFRSIKEPLSLKFVTEKRLQSEDLPYNTFKESDNELLRSLVIYGRNAAGKSNVIMAFKALSYLIEKSDTFKHDKKLSPYEPFLFDTKNKEKPVKFEVEFLGIDSKIKYIYSIEIGEDEIKKESLFFYPVGVISKLYERIENKISYGDYYKGTKKAIEDDLLKNQLFLSKASRNKVKYLDEVYLFFTRNLNIITVHDTEYDNIIIQSFAKLTNENQKLKANVLELLKAADTSILDFNINENDIKFPEDISDKLKEKLLESFKFDIHTVHSLFENGLEIGKTSIKLEKESFGTKKFLAIGSLILSTLDNGGIIVIDELDKGLHPLLTKLLIGLFNSKNNNPNNAQLVFATHDSTLLDNDIFRRDQICFVDKEYEGGSILYKLSDIKGIRKDIPIDKWYLSGRFKAIPVTSEINLKF